METEESNMRAKRFSLSLLSAILFFLLGTQLSVQAQETKWVNDETNLLSQELLDGITKLNEKVYAEYDNKPQLGIEVLNTLPEGFSDIDEYRVERFEELGIGDDEHDSGILFILLLEDRKFAIETGYGIEPIITDLEARRILEGDMKNYLIEYSDTGNPAYLNDSVTQTVNEITTILDKADTGVLFEERKAIEDVRAATDKFFKTIFISILMSPFVLGMMILGTEFIERRKKEKAKKKLTKKAEELKDVYSNLYIENTFSFKNEINSSNIFTALNLAVNEMNEEMLVSAEIDKQAFLNTLRLKYFNGNIKDIKEELKRYPFEYYSDNIHYFRKQIEKDENYTLENFIKDMNQRFDEETERYKTYDRQVFDEVQRYAQGKIIPKFIKKDQLYGDIRHRVKNYLNLGKENIKSLSVGTTNKQEIRKALDRWFKYSLLQGVLENDKQLNSIHYGRGSREEFNDYSLNELSGSIDLKTLMDDTLRTTVIVSLVERFVHLKEKEYQAELKRKEEQEKREAEAARRRRQAAIYSSSSSSSSISSGGFGSGFGGGSSGGGGASGGW